MHNYAQVRFEQSRDCYIVTTQRHQSPTGTTQKKLGHMATHNPIPSSSKLRSIVNLPVREKIHRNKQRFEKG